MKLVSVRKVGGFKARGLTKPNVVYTYQKGKNKYEIWNDKVGEKGSYFDIFLKRRKPESGEELKGGFKTLRDALQYIGKRSKERKLTPMPKGGRIF
jgi:hypothetical protein